MKSKFTKQQWEMINREGIRMPALFYSTDDNTPDFIINITSLVKERGRNVPKELKGELIYSDGKRLKLRYKLMESERE